MKSQQTFYSLRPHAHIDSEFYVIVVTFEATTFCDESRFAIISLDEFWDTVRERYDERLIKEVGNHALIPWRRT